MEMRTKTIGFASLLAGLLALSALTGVILAIQAPSVGTGNPSFKTLGYDTVQKAFIEGNIQLYAEGQHVPIEIVLENKDSRGAVPFPLFDIVYDFHQDSSDAIGVDFQTDFRWISGQPDPRVRDPGGTPFVIPPSMRNVALPSSLPKGGVDTVRDPADQRYYRIDPAALGQGFPQSIGPLARLTIFLKAHISMTLVWLDHPEAEPSLPDYPYGTDYAAHAGGASKFTGSSLRGFVLSPVIGGQKSMPSPFIGILPGHISGHKWHDLNGNGYVELGEPGIPGWGMTLTGTIEGDGFIPGIRMTTDANGAYRFDNMPPGTFTVREDAFLPGEAGLWVHSTPPQVTVTLTVTPETSGGKTVWRTSSAENVDFLNYRATPKVAIDKDGPAMAHVGDTITFTFAVTNIGNVPIDGSVTDDVLGYIGSFAGLMPGASTTLSTDFVVPPTDNTDADPANDDPIVNTATVEAVFGPFVVSASDSHTTDILHPSIEVAKSGPAYGHVGETVTYTFVVTNTGDATLSDGTLVDDRIGALWFGLTLAPGESQTFTATYVVPDGADPLGNTATACGTDALGLSVCGTGSHSLDVLHPRILVAVAVIPQPDGSVVYRVWVMNPSADTDLFGTAVAIQDLGITLTFGDVAAGAETAYQTVTTGVVTFPYTQSFTASGADVTGYVVTFEIDVTVVG